MVLLVVMVLNTGDHTTTRMRVQDAADAAVMTQATWIARSLNLLAMNNVAITQTAALVLITEALVLPLEEALREALEKEKQYLESLSKCGGPPPAFVACVAAWLALLADLNIRVVRPLIEIGIEISHILPDFLALTQALEEMNETVISEFPDLTAQIARALARENGLEHHIPLFLTGYRSPDEQRYDTTSLPIAKVTFGDMPSPLCLSGKYGTPHVPLPSVNIALSVIDMYTNWNFQQHGYPRNQGPYDIGQDSANRAISRPVNALERAPHFGQVSLKFQDVVEEAWLAACQTRSLLFHQITLYRVTNQPVPGFPVDEQTREHWSLLAFTRKPQTGATILPQSFANPPQAIYAYAQAEIYNPINYDLYTQDWRARLVPARLLNPRQKEAIIKATNAFPTLQRLLEAIIDDQTFRATNLH